MKIIKDNKNKSGKFSKEDVGTIHQSVRKDRYWTFIRRQVKEKFSQTNQKQVVAEIGCGTGAMAILTAKKLTTEVSEYICIDASEDMLNFVRIENLPRTKIICADVEKAKTLPTADIYIARFLFHHIKEKKELLKKINEALSKDGELLFIDKFPRFGIISIGLEKLLHILHIRRVLGTHYYISLNEFLKLCKQTGFIFDIKWMNSGSMFRNFFTIRAEIVIRKN